MTTFTDSEVADLRKMLARFRDQLDEERTRILHVFQHTLENFDPTIVLNVAGTAALATPGGERDAAAVAVASAIDLPLTGFDPSLHFSLKCFVFERLEELRPQAIGDGSLPGGLYGWFL